MGFSRRALLTSAASAIAFKSEALDMLNRAVDFSGTGAPDDEDFWTSVRTCFDTDPAVTMLNNGGVSPSPRTTQDALRRVTEACNRGPSNIMWRVYEPIAEDVRKKLAAYIGCDSEEVAIVRNASEANQTIIMGIDMVRGDEIVTTDFDYPRMITACEQRVRREGVVLRKAHLPAVPKTEDELIEPIVREITSRTKLIVVSHVCFLNGLVLPVKRIAAIAHERGIPILVDGAHALGQWPFMMHEINAFSYGAALHKWMLGPIGTGCLFIKKENIEKVWSLQPSDDNLKSDIRKFEQIGTHPAAIHNALGESLDFHEMLGRDRIAARIQYLKMRWVNQVRELPGVEFHTSLDPHFARGLTVVKVGKIPAGDLAGWLMSKHGIFVTTTKGPGVDGMRISASVYTLTKEVDKLAAALKVAARDGI